MLNIVIPMAGAGSRFSKKGYKDPKPLIPIENVPMIELVINNLRPNKDHRFIFICQEQHIQNYGLTEKLSKWAPGCKIISLNAITDGAACTVLTAKEYINNDEELMIANSDQYVDIDINQYLSQIDDEGVCGLIMTMKASDPKWSYVGIGHDGFISRVVEKEVISNEATVGIYNFKKGKDFVRAATEMIEMGLKVNNEFYVAPSYNQLIGMGKKIRAFNIGSEARGMYGLGTPIDLNLFISLPIHKKAIQNIS